MRPSSVDDRSRAERQLFPLLEILEPTVHLLAEARERLEDDLYLQLDALEHDLARSSSLEAWSRFFRTATLRPLLLNGRPHEHTVDRPSHS